MTNFSVGTLAELKTALATSATDNVADTITLTADISATGSADFTAGTGGNDLLQIAVTDGQSLSIVGGGHTLDAHYLGRVLEVSTSGAGSTVAISDLTITEGGLSADGGFYDSAGGAALGAGVYNAGDLTLRDVTVSANAASGGGGGGSGTDTSIGHWAGGGGGGGGLGGVAGSGGNGRDDRSRPDGYGGHAPSGGLGGSGGASFAHSGQGGGGGSSTGGAGGTYGVGQSGGGGAGGTATIGGLSLGGGGGGDGRGIATTVPGGAAVGGVYNSGTLHLSGGAITGNLAAGGGGGGAFGAPSVGSVGGAAVGGIQNTGTLVVGGGASITGNAAGAGGGGGGPGNDFADAGAETNDLSGSANFLHTGGLSITGTATQGETLTADSSTLADDNGLGNLSYQWKSDGVDISDATSSTFVLTPAQVGHVITVTGSYTDGDDFAESATSAATSAVAIPNHAPTGSVTISGTAIDGQTLTAHNTLADADGLGTISYQWKADGTEISGATSSTFTLGQAQVGHVITVEADYTDLGETAESVTSAASAAVTEPVVTTPPAVVTTVDGASVSTTTVTASDGSQSHSVVVTPLADGHAAADIPLLFSAGGDHLLTVSLPAGIGLSASGPTAAEASVAAATHLGDALAATASGPDQGQLVDGANAFLQLHSTASIQVQTLILSGDASDAPIDITGSTSDTGQRTALVIDASHLSAPQITLNSVDFAAVVGAVHLTGGAGGETVFGDGSVQTIALGDGDDVLHGGGGDDVLQGNAGDDHLQGNTGNDLLHGGQGNDIALGGQDNDTLSGDLGNDLVQGNLGKDSLDGGDGADTLRGGQGDDVLVGGAGDDLLSGDLGNDTLTGGTGADTFVYAKGGGADVITDFRQSEGDHLQLSGAHDAYTTAQVGADTVVNFGGGDQIVLANVQLSSLSSGWITG